MVQHVSDVNQVSHCVSYRSFLGRLGKYLEKESGRHSEMYIKYTPEDLETHLLDLFHGNPSSHGIPSSLGSGRSQKEGDY